MKRARLIIAAAILTMAAAGCASRPYDPCARADFERAVVRINHPLGSCCRP